MKSFNEYISEGWSKEYKRSINCNNPKGFSQRAHCQGRKKHESIQVDEASKTVNWVRPKVATLKQEYEIEYKKHLIHDVGNVFPTVESFLDAAKEGIVRTITKNHDYYIQNRSHTKNMKELLSLIKTYRSYPQYRNEDTLKAMKEAMLSGKPMDMPIIVRERNIKDIGKHDRIFAGNTRMDMAFMHGITPKALIIFLPQGVKLS